MLAVMLIAAGPVLLGAPTAIPHLAWVGLFVLMLVAMMGALWSGEDPRSPGWRTGLLLGIAVLASWGLVLGARGAGLVAILLVITVAVSPYLVPIRVGWALIVLNLAVLLGALAPRSGEPGWLVEISIMLGFYLLIQAASLLSSVALLREQRARRELTEAHVDLQAAAVLLADSARTSERLRISRDLHDLIGHQLTVLALELEAAKHRMPGGDGAAADTGEAGDPAAPRGDGAAPHIERAAGVARELLSSVRATVGELRNDGGELRETLQRVVQDLTEPRVVLEVDDALRLDEDRTVLLVRAVQEIVTNTIRHARAGELRIEVRRTRDGVVLCARDDGWGSRGTVLGNGLLGLRERFEGFGGSAVFMGGGAGSGPGAGSAPGAEPSPGAEPTPGAGSTPAGSSARAVEPAGTAGFRGFGVTARLPVPERSPG
ncbi:two-component sensor histidine kinase [Leucobacter sp. CSA1]|uniref:Two-component sensor histidine kinase n=2 Tax=Leucobacter chromiisoli TaxID=2796471 RepID=A0A934UU20_9MICO|nr:two-component sensor histidine kinase [Leucobacter chromiisoli]